RNEGTLRRELGIGPEIPLAGIVARLVPIKGIPAFLRAAKQVLEKFSDARFVIVGDGELREGLEKLTEELGIKKSTHFLGFRDDLENIYPDLDVLVLTSRNEGSPVSLIEGLASGCAVVSTRVGGVEDVVKDGKTGILVGRTTEEETAKNLGHVICTLLENPEKRLEFGESGKKDVLKRFGIERLVADLDGLYRRLLAEKGIL
ncbi:MAG: glycosyltransferase family 4 protein, partial [Elusimicrobia bacterium]|nr:glycosyltransferase family 4 protein [Elusimicrobiota bacterium]